MPPKVHLLHTTVGVVYFMAAEDPHSMCFAVPRRKYVHKFAPCMITSLDSHTHINVRRCMKIAFVCYSFLLQYVCMLNCSHNVRA
jgi:hypothetical protein